MQSKPGPLWSDSQGAAVLTGGAILKAGKRLSLRRRWSMESEEHDFLVMLIGIVGVVIGLEVLFLVGYLFLQRFPHM